ncbi:MAG: hypothetical protein HOP07_02480 [Bacteriovoracaceae bacterium]|nr:hypothetical protein [Bacteriovoracaceae bacterium]
MKFTKIYSTLIFGFLLLLSSPLKSQEVELTNLSNKSLPMEILDNTLNGKTDIYSQIAKEFDLEYENIGKREALRVLSNNALSITGGLNSIGLSYKKPFVSFGVSVDRNLAPDLYDDKRWIVTDTMTIDIDASKVLGSLKDSNAIDISEKNLAAFAGVVFKRKFTWIHFANSYEEGLMRDFQKLFMPFNLMSFENIAKLGLNEMLFKEDSISLKAGGLVSAPLYTGITGAAGVLAKFERLSRVEIIGLEDNRIQISSEKSKIASAGASLSIQADFLKILRLTLLSYDFSYDLQSSYKIYLNMSQIQLKENAIESNVKIELAKIFKNKEAELVTIAPFLISEEKKISQTINHKYNFLLLGGQKSSKTQQIEIAKDGKVKTFFRHYYEKMKYTEDAVSRLFSSLIFGLTNSDISATKLASDTKKVTIEYDSTKNLLDSKSDLDIGLKNSEEQKLSMSFISDFKTQKTSGRSGKKYKERAKFILERFSGVNPIALTMIDSGDLKAPFHVEGKYQVNIEGIRYFNSQSVASIFDHFDGLCNEYPKSGLINFRNLFDHCRRSLEDDYIDYFKDLTHNKISAEDIDRCEKKSFKYLFSPGKKRAFIKNCLSEMNKLSKEEWVRVPLWQLKNLSTNIVNNSYSKVHYFNLFGVQNVFFYGTFKANTKEGNAFTTSFHEGSFKGLGAVDHYMRVENLRSPASIVIDQ